LGGAHPLGRATTGPGRDRVELRAVDQQEHGASMAESGRSQAAPGPTLAPQPRSRVSGESPPNRAIVPAAAASQPSALRRREDAAADPRTRPSDPARGSRGADSHRADVPAPRGRRDAGGVGRPDRAGDAPGPPTSPASGVPGVAAGASASVASRPTA